MSKKNNLIGYSNLPSGLLPFLTAYWTADNIATDVHINNLGGSWNSGTHYATGINGNAFNHNDGGGRFWVDVPNNNLLSFTDGVQDVPFTIRFWVYFDTTYVNFQFIFAKRISSFSEYNINVRPNEQKILFSKASLGNNNNRVTTETNYDVPIGSWNMVTVTSDATKFGEKIYINGVDLTTIRVEHGTYARMTTGNISLRLGSSVLSNSFTLKGKTDEHALFNGYEMTPAEVLSDYNGGIGKFYPNI